MNSNFKKWMLRPFEYISEQKALSIGLASILFAGVINSFTNAHFDGVIDFHYSINEGYSFISYVCEGFINWIIFSGVLYISGLIFSTSSIRIIDVFGMQAFARWPFLLVALFTLILPHPAVYEYLKNLQPIQNPQQIIVPFYQWIFFGLLALIVITVMVWTIILMYRAYSLSCNLKGTKGIISFIVALFIAEAIIKYLLYLINGTMIN